MKQFYTLLVLAFTVITANAQIVNIPDAIFKSIITNPNPLGTTARDINGDIMVVDTNLDGEIQISEALNVYSISVGARYINSLNGIEYFTNLRSLSFNANNITSINVSSLINLTSLNCNDNNLTSLNVSGLNNLENLFCGQNNLTSLDTSNLNNLISLSCGSNILTSLNVLGSNNLQTIYCNNNNLSTLNLSNLSSLTSIQCSNNSLSSITLIGLTNLKDIICYSNQLTSLNLTGLNSLENLFCNNNQITTINASNFPNLQTLVCGYNQITSLNVNGSNNLIKIDCGSNSLSSINLNGLNNLTSLYIYLNQLTALNFAGLNSMQTLVCYQNQINTLDVSGLQNLKYLDCSINQIASITVGNLIQLETLKISSNNITSIDISGLSGLKEFDCRWNSITSLNFNGLSLVEYIDCKNNLLNTINLNGLINLTSLTCSNNQLTSLEINQLTKLNLLDCSTNQINIINANELIYLYYLSANNNMLTSLYIKNGKIENALTFSSNPNLSYICADENQIESIQNTLNQIGYTNCSLNSYCSFVPGGVFYNIQGNSKFDNNNNGCDVNDINILNQKFNITNGSVTGTLISNSSGSYSIPVQAGTHTLTPVFENLNYFTISPTNTTVTFPAATSPFTQNFCVTANGIKNDVEVTIISTSAARPGFDANYKIVYKNKGNQVSNGSLSFSFDDSKMDLVSVMPVNTSSATNSLTWNYSNLIPFETREIDLVFNINSPMETPAVNSGDLISFNASIVDTSNETPNNNSFTLNQTVVNSYDPNDKTCLEGNTITPSMVGNYVHYVIRFENTGTFAAENVVVTDMIDLTKFDIASLIPQSSSHSFVTRINNTTGKVEFIFENINLPFDDANNDGYVAFKIKTKPTLVLGNTFSNTANIYFDYNFPIVTNTTSTTVSLLSTQDFDFGTYFALYPTPAKEILNINVKATIGIKSVAVYNLLGQMVLAYTNPENSSSLDVSQLKTGTYIIKIVTDKGTASQKFSKE